MTMYCSGFIGHFDTAVTSQSVLCMFVEICSENFFVQLGLQDGHLHRANGMLVLLSFLCCRILLFPYMYLAYGRQHGLPLLSVPLHLPLHCNIGNLAILAPQIYWFCLLCRKARRLYLRQTKPKDPDALTRRSKTQ